DRRAAQPGRGRTLAGREAGTARALRRRRPRAGPGGAALHPGNHHQCRAPRRRHHPVAGLAPGRRGDHHPRPRRRPRHRPAGRRQRPARHARAPGRLRRAGRGADRARPGIFPRPAPAAGPRARRRHPMSTSSGDTTMIRVCLVDDQTLVRQGVRSLLELSENIRIVAEAGDGRQAVELIPEIKPDVVLLDMRMPVMSGLETLQYLSERDQLPPTIILTTFDDDQLVLAGLKAGARGYLLKDVSLEQLVDAIETVARGGSLVQPVVTQRLLSGLERMHNDFSSLDRPDPLTERETEILRLMAGGYSNKEIANSLGVAEGTVKNHVSNILSKLGVRDRTRAVLKAFEL